ncbi:hypothetical protein Tco_0683604, partial [Tanacetum coccineum]
MPLALKRQNDSFQFVHELKQEMHADLKYVESIENEIDELKSDKAEFSNMYDILLPECVSKDVMCSYLHSLSNLDAHAELQCLYLHKVKECECLAQKHSKQTKTTYDVNAPGPSRKSPKYVSFQSPRESVGSDDMVHNYYLEEAKKTAQLQKDKALNTKPSIPIGHKFSLNKSSAVYLKTMPPRSGLTWKPTGRIFTQVGLKWIPIRKSVETCYNTNDSASPLGKKTHNPNTTICANSSSLSEGKMGSNEEIRRLAQEAEKQQLFAQKVQQQNTNLTSQLEMYKERVRILEGINKDNNYLNEFLEADERAKRYNKQAQSQFVRDRDIIRDLEKQRDKLELDVKDYKRQKEEYQKTQTIFNQTQRNKEEKYLDDILQLQAKIKDLENVVCKMGKSTETLRLLTNEQKAFRDNLHKSGLGYNGPYVLSQAYAKIPKLYRAYELCDKNKQLHVFDSEETLEDAEKSQLKMNEFQKDEKVQELKIQPIDYGKLNKLYDSFVSQKDLSAEQTYFSSSCTSSVSKISSEEFSSKTKPSMGSMPSANPMLVDLNEMENIFQTLFKLIQKICKRDEKEMNLIVQK